MGTDRAAVCLLGCTCLPARAHHWVPQAPGSVCLTQLSFPSRSIFKPFIFVDDVKLVPKAQSPCFGDDDPAKKEPRFQEKPDRRHELYKAHEWARAVMENDQVSPKELEGGCCRSVRKETERWPACIRTSLLSSLTGLFQKDTADVNFPTTHPETKENEASAFTVTLNPEG